ncbi:MAG: hypothetical protein KME13_27290 [Myxacorys californica WJT36-NPBG1]|jgi:type II secretory ATPase GspE/PulE/Tfp pilus assembly ATPase PilB-like protein|nr:hypothetical protein [Myxacorys californica WJT36-NPBG1]
MVSSPSNPFELDNAIFSEVALCANRVSNGCLTHHLNKALSVAPEGMAEVDTEKAFQLVDRVLPFEACLYHQILPLSLEAGCLYLGMVTLEDAIALDYVRRLVGFMNYTLAPQRLSSEAHYAALSAYLNYSQAQRKTPAEPSSISTGSQTRVEETIAEKVALDFHSNDTFHSKDTYILESPDELDREEEHCTSSPEPTSQRDQLSMPGSALPVLEVSTTHLNSSDETLAQLPPDQLLQELLGRIFIDGIGRLYLERQATSGRVLWSQNGILQSVINELPLPVFQGLLNELKRLTHLPPSPLQTAQQVEIERLCQNNRVLLRLRMMPNTHGEEATLQILRGAALKFYQKQQLTNLSRDALGIAKDLQRKLGEIRDRRTQASQPLPVDSSTVIPTLGQVLQIVEQQLVNLQDLDQEA